MTENARPIEVADGTYLLDCLFAGLPRQCGVFLVRGERTALVDTGPTVAIDDLVRGMEALGFSPADVDLILLTHFHLDHAGATAFFLENNPDARVHVDGRSARYMADPQRLVQSAQRALGRIAPHYGTMPPVPPDKIVPLEDGLAIDLGGRTLTAIHAPGHSSGHYAFHEAATGMLFCGDALGHYVEADGFIYPATPPPEFDPDTSIATSRKLAALDPELLLFPHFGSSARPAETFERFARQVERSIELAESLEPSQRTPRGLATLLLADFPRIDKGEEPLMRGILEVNAAGVLHYLKG